MVDGVGVDLVGDGGVDVEEEEDSLGSFEAAVGRERSVDVMIFLLRRLDFVVRLREGEIFIKEKYAT